jgi:hypothetical protein
MTLDCIFVIAFGCCIVFLFLAWPIVYARGLRDGKRLCKKSGDGDSAC